ncbi:hypothetical protein GCM10029992_38290 [Glycomyces albus]
MTQLSDAILQDRLEIADCSCSNPQLPTPAGGHFGDDSGELLGHDPARSLEIHSPVEDESARLAK